MLQFDIHTRKDWEERDVHCVSVDFVSAGCDGTEIRIYENIEKEEYIPLEVMNSAIICYTRVDNSEVLEGSFITGVKGKWILMSDKVLTRCGCSKSFSLKSGDNFSDKIKLLRAKLAKKPKHSL